MEEGALPYHIALDSLRELDGRRILPLVSVVVQLFPEQEQVVPVTAMLDGGADWSVFDGNVALDAGWTARDIVDRAMSVVPIRGIGPGPAVLGYVHQVTAFLGSSTRFAELRLRVAFTLPDSLEHSVLGRSDFFEQVDVTFAEFEKRLYLRFRNPAVLREYA